MEIDRRIRAKEFMYYLGVGQNKFYSMISEGDIKQPVKLSERDVFWYLSYVKEKVEEHKNSDIVAA